MPSRPALRPRILDSLREVPSAQWDALVDDLPTKPTPFLKHAFLSALEDNGCVGPKTGWTPRFVTLWESDRLVAAMPLYLKDHSYGEYVFDWAWARAYHEHGVDYYPKLLCAVPFTPVRGPRLLAPTTELRAALLQAAIQLTGETSSSSLHILFPPDEILPELDQAQMMTRSNVQFHWHNTGFTNFDDFLATMNHDKRKKIKQERRRVRDAGLHFVWRTGGEASEAEWDFFSRCYHHTYRAHGFSPYLNRRFFGQLAAAMPQHLLLIVALLDGQPVASALNIIDADTLYGRYWGSVGFLSGLHFETCYYQAIEFCIAHRLQRFEGGAQGEHKLARGLLPVRMHSAHWIAHPGFSRAIAQYLRQEDGGITHYVDELNEHSPFKAHAL
ncbi:MAG: N-acetyltransferase [Betaproteobacteria bacterium]|nr:N-acetyltransferase [Betaproteobacteria bacterium]